MTDKALARDMSGEGLISLVPCSVAEQQSVFGNRAADGLDLAAADHDLAGAAAYLFSIINLGTAAILAGADACAAACGDVLDVLRSKRSEGIWFAPGQRVAAQERMERIDRALLRAVRRAERLADPIAELEEEQAVGIPVEPSEAWPAWEEEEAPPRSEAVLEKLLARTERLSETVVRLLAGLDGI